MQPSALFGAIASLAPCLLPLAGLAILILIVAKIGFAKSLKLAIIIAAFFLCAIPGVVVDSGVRDAHPIGLVIGIICGLVGGGYLLVMIWDEPWLGPPGF